MDTNNGIKLLRVLVLFLGLVILVVETMVLLFTQNIVYLIIIMVSLTIMFAYFACLKNINDIEDFTLTKFKKVLNGVSKFLTFKKIRSDNVKDKFSKDCSTFSSYDEAIELDNTAFSQFDIKVLDVERYQTKNKDKNKLKNVYVYCYNQTYKDYTRYSKYQFFNVASFVYLSEIDSVDRMHISVKKKTFYDVENLKFDDIFVDYKDVVNKFDEKFGDTYSENYICKYNNKKFMNSGENEYYKLSTKVKNELVKLFIETGLHFSVILEAGVLRIKVDYALNKDEEENLDDLSIIFERISKLFM